MNKNINTEEDTMIMKWEKEERERSEEDVEPTKQCCHVQKR
jgi:hypothetical protein